MTNNIVILESRNILILIIKLQNISKFYILKLIFIATFIQENKDHKIG
jgi:hypothetical protein